MLTTFKILLQLIFEQLSYVFYLFSFRSRKIVIEAVESTKITQAKFYLNLNTTFYESGNIQEKEFKVFSQWGQDGIIQYLVSSLKIKNKTFIEFGTQDYLESNTRFLLMNNNWSGFIVDGDRRNIFFIRRSELSWKFDLTAEQSFLSKENINEVLKKSKFKDLGLLSVDVDGNDYWLLDAIDFEYFSPAIIICEYNSMFGKERSISVPYDPGFIRSKKHYSNLYFGASLPALYHLNQKRGYSFVGCNSNGNDAFFVKSTLLKQSKLKAVSLNEGFVQSKFRESRDRFGNLTHLSFEERMGLLKGLPVVNTITGEVENL